MRSLFPDHLFDKRASLLHWPSISRRLASVKNRPAGFDYLRIVLALAIVADHAIIACSGEQAQRDLFNGATRPLLAILVPMFFALSGFLVASSLIRNRNLITFAGLRVLRIVPALAVDTLFCALIIGVLLTSVPLREYFSSREFAKYFLNIVGDIHYTLPGLFLNNPSNVVNAQLWTIPFELKCYIALTVMALIGLHKRRLLFLGATTLILLSTVLYIARYPAEINDVWHLLIPSFLFGVCIFIYREQLSWNPWLMAASVVASIILLYQTNAIMTFAAIPIAYATVWLGLLDGKRDPIIRSGDYSYSIYLYSFPIQQAVIALTPLGRFWLVNFIFALPVTFALSAFSWHFVEKPMQERRHYLYKFEAWLRARRNKDSNSELEGGSLPPSDVAGLLASHHPQVTTKS
jgi:peptidoglycan/LPS O-acetylase OafA/YrhL